MSLAEQQATYYRDPDTGFLMMPGTRRPDGTWRKPRRIKEGYVPQDEVPLYESKGKQQAREKAAGVGIPGLNYSGGGVGGLSKGILDMKIGTFDSRAARAEGIATGAGIPGLAPDLVKSTSQLQQSQQKSAKKKHKSKSNSSSSSSHNQSNSSGCNSIPAAASTKPVAEAQKSSEDPVKRLRNLKKKLRDIEALEAKMEEGAKLEPEQMEKVSRKIQVENEIDELESKV